MSATVEDRLVQVVRQNQWNELILARAPKLGVNDWWLTAGCIAQSVWNHVSGRDIHAGIRDYDLFYYDADTSWAAEDQVIVKAGEIFSDLPVEVQVRNQARVPIWYETKFGIPFGVAVGVKRVEETFEVYSMFGLESLFGGTLKPNRALPIRDVYAEKTGRWQQEWPHLRCESW
jgi:hypothetical protein